MQQYAHTESTPDRSGRALGLVMRLLAVAICLGVAFAAGFLGAHRNRNSAQPARATVPAKPIAAPSVTVAVATSVRQLGGKIPALTAAPPRPKPKPKPAKKPPAVAAPAPASAPAVSAAAPVASSPPVQYVAPSQPVQQYSPPHYTPPQQTYTPPAPSAPSHHSSGPTIVPAKPIG